MDIEALKAALKPFADAAKLADNNDDLQNIWYNINSSDLRRAASAYAALASHTAPDIEALKAFVALRPVLEKQIPEIGGVLLNWPEQKIVMAALVAIEAAALASHGVMPASKGTGFASFRDEVVEFRKGAVAMGHVEGSFILRLCDAALASHTVTNRREVLEEALRRIERWEMPETGKFWATSGEPMSWGAAYGSRGEREVIQEIARVALSALPVPVNAGNEASEN